MTNEQEIERIRRIGSRVQHIEKLANQAEAQFKESRGEK